MTISAVYSRRKIRLPHRNNLLLLALAVLLAGCIQPDAPLPGATAVTVTPLPAPSANPASAAPIGAPTVAAPAAPPTTPPTAGGASVYPLDVDRVWKLVPVGPEQVAILFFQQAGAYCVRYIFRAKLVPKCASAGQVAVAISGTEQAADGKTYTIIAGRAIDTRITVLSIEFPGGTNSPAPIDNQGFALVVEGARKPTDAVPVDAHGDLIGAKVLF